MGVEMQFTADCAFINGGASVGQRMLDLISKAGKQSDWEETDNTDLAFILNKPFGYFMSRSTILESESEVSHLGPNGMYQITLDLEYDFDPDHSFRVTRNTQVDTCTASTNPAGGYLLLDKYGDIVAQITTNLRTITVYYPSMFDYVKVEQEDSVLKKIDEIFLPDDFEVNAQRAEAAANRADALADEIEDEIDKYAAMAETLAQNAANDALAHATPSVIDTFGDIKTAIGRLLLACDCPGNLDDERDTIADWIGWIRADSVTVAPASSTITRMNTTKQLTATLSPSNTNDKVNKWFTSDPNVAVVDGNGVVSPVANGTCTITAKTLSGKMGTATVKVNIPSSTPATGVTISPTTITLTAGDTGTMTAIMTPSTTTDRITWTSSDPNVASVDNNGVITAVSPGACEITATADSGASATAGVVVRYPDGSGSVPATAITVTPAQKSVEVNSSFSASYTLTPANSTDGVVCHSSNTGIATAVIRTPGIVTVSGKSVGSCYITLATTSGQNAVISVEVIAASTDRGGYILMVENGNTANMKYYKIGDTELVVVANWTMRPFTPFTSDQDVARVTKGNQLYDGSIYAGGGRDSFYLTAKGNGTCNVGVKDEDGTIIDYRQIEVDTTKYVGIQTMSLDQSVMNMHVGDSLANIATVTPNNTNDRIYWRSSDENIAVAGGSLSNNNGTKSGFVRAISPGTCTVTAESGSGITATFTVNVTE